MESKARAQELFVTMRGAVRLLVVRPPAPAPASKRLSSSSSKDSGHNSGTASSKSSQSSAGEPAGVPGKEENFLSTDSDFYYVDGKLKEINEFCREEAVQGTWQGGGIMVDPVYEMIAECGESEGDELYCLPQDSAPAPVPAISRSVSSPHTTTLAELAGRGVVRSTSSYQQQGGGAGQGVARCPPASLGETIRSQQAELRRRVGPHPPPV